MPTPDKIVPDLQGLVSPQVQLRIEAAFRRVYEYFEFLLAQQKQENESKLKQATQTQLSDVNSLIGIFSQPLAGSQVTDPLLQTVMQEFGPQAPNNVFAGPIPTFRPLTLADLPPLVAGPADRLDANGTILDVNVINDGEYLKRQGATVVSGNPNNILGWLAQ